MHKQQRYEEAEAAFREAIRAAPDDAESWATLGHVLTLQRKDYHEVVATFRKAIELDPEDPGTRTYLAKLLYLTDGDLTEALTHSQRSVQIQADNAAWLCTLATIHAALGDWPSARKTALAWMELDDADGFEHIWDDILGFFQEAVYSGFAQQALSLLDETGFRERWRPLREALAEITTGSDTYLNGIAPEIREPAREIAQRLRKQPKRCDFKKEEYMPMWVYLFWTTRQYPHRYP